MTDYIDYVIHMDPIFRHLKTGFFRATVETVLLCRSTAGTLTQSLDTKLDGAHPAMLTVVKNVTWPQSITYEVLYAGLSRISTTIRERHLRFSCHCWRSNNEVVSDLVLWEQKHGKRSVGGLAGTFANLLQAGTFANLPQAGTFVRLLQAGTFVHLLQAGTFVRLLQAGTFVHLPQAGTFVRLLQAGTFVHLLQAGTFVRLLQAGTFVHLPQAGTFVHLLQAGTFVHLPQAGTFVHLLQAGTFVHLLEVDTSNKDPQRLPADSDG